MWQEAYRANPRVYENPQDQSILAGFALTEDTPSLFPSCAGGAVGDRGKNDKLVDDHYGQPYETAGSIIGQMEYHEAMERLRPYIVAAVDNWALIRGMTHDELDGLFEGRPREQV